MILTTCMKAGLIVSITALCIAGPVIVLCYSEWSGREKWVQACDAFHHETETHIKRLAVDVIINCVDIGFKVLFVIAYLMP